MATHKGHFRWFNEEEVYGKKQWTRVYFVLHVEERALYIYKQKKEQSKEWKKVDVSQGSCENGSEKGKKHVFVFTANDQKKYIFRSEHKNKKKQWIRYLNEAGADKKKAEEKPAEEKPAEEKKVEEKKPEPAKEDESSSSDDESSSSDGESSDAEEEEAAAAAAKKKADEEAEAARKKEAEEAEAKRKADEEAAAAAAAKKAQEEEAAAAAAKKKADEEAAAAAAKKAEEEEESSSSDSSSDSSESESESEEAEKEEEKKEEEASEIGKNVTVENTYPRLLHLQGKKKTDITITHVPAVAASVNDSDVFILDNNKTVYTWLGSSPNMWQKQAAAALARALDDERGSDVANLVISQPTSSDAAAFWKLLGGQPETLSKAAPEAQPPILFQLSDASGKMEFKEVGRGNPLKRSLLDANDVFIADLGFHIFVWIGKKASREERDKAVGYAVVYRQSHKRPQYIHVERVMDGGENEVLYSFFTQ